MLIDCWEWSGMHTHSECPYVPPKPSRSIENIFGLDKYSYLCHWWNTLHHFRDGSERILVPVLREEKIGDTTEMESGTDEQYG